MDKIKRKIITIDEELCNGCGECIPGCPEQAIQLVETSQGKKASLVKEFYCDGLGACLGHCPVGAISIEEREADPYDEEATIDRILEVAPEKLVTHLQHLMVHDEKSTKPIHLHENLKGCPSSQDLEWKKNNAQLNKDINIPSELSHWPIQLSLVNPSASYFQKADLIIVADCVPFAYGNFHCDFLKGKTITIGCPKLDDVEEYIDKIAQIIKIGQLNSLTIIHMEVPCCYGLVSIVKEALKRTGRNLPFKKVIISLKGELLNED